MSGSSQNFMTLREANVARQALWDPTNQLDWDWRCNELAGEAGEVCNVLKKLHREKLGLPGSRATVHDLADELADVAICADLCAMTLDVPPIDPNAFDNGLEKYSATAQGKYLIAAVGLVCEDHPTRYSPGQTLERVVAYAHKIAQSRGISLDNAIAYKFNKTSEKVGLPVTLRVINDADAFADAVQGSRS